MVLGSGKSGKEGLKMAQASSQDDHASDGHKNFGKGLALPGLIVGLLTGAAMYGIVEFWIDDADDKTLASVVLLFIVTAAASYLLLAETNRLIRATGAALLIAAIFALPDYFILSQVTDEAKNLTGFPAVFWFLSRGLVVYLTVTLAKSVLEAGAPPPYREVFFHGLTIPLIAGGAKLFAGLALVLLFAWARLLKEMDVNFFNKLFQEPWFILPFLGAIGGLAIAMMRGQQAVLGALRFILLLFCRIVMPITALFTITLLIILVTKGTGVIFDRPYPSVWIIVLALTGMLIFNGVYQNGEGGPPPAWLRISTLITLVGFPIYSGLAFTAIMLRIGDYGLTPPRIAGVAITGLVAAYSLVCLAGLLTELNWRAKRWMPLVAPLNTAMAAVWIVVLTALATPLANPWAISADSQYRLIASERVAAEDFDFGYMRFELGRYGDAALERMLGLKSHPEAQAISAGVARAHAAKNRWEYDNPELASDADNKENPVTADPNGPMGLELNPDGVEPDDPDTAQPEATQPETTDADAGNQ
jgi:Domain of unknown function (DUF4153)